MALNYSTPLDLGPVLDHGGQCFNVRHSDFNGGADPTGVTNSTVAFQQAITAAQNSPDIPVFVPGGDYLITPGSLSITKPIAIIGNGPRFSRIIPAGATTGWVISLDDVWRVSGAGGMSGQIAPDLDFDVTKFGAMIQGIGIYGSRSDTGTVHGIRTYDRVDDLVLRDVWIYALTGTGLSLGKEQTTNGLIRESVFENVWVRGCGSASNPAVQIGGGSAADGCNQLRFDRCRFVYNFGKVKLQSGTVHTRRIRLTDLMLHGLHTDASAPALDVMSIDGDVRDVVGDIATNGSHDVSAVKYACIRIENAVAAANAPSDIRLNVDMRSCNGHGIAIDKAQNRILIGGTADVASIAGNELLVAANAVASEDGVQYDVIAAEASRSISVDSTVANFVNARAWLGGGPNLMVGSGTLKFADGETGSSARIPSIYYGTGTPAAVVTAADGSIYMRLDGDGNYSWRKLWSKAAFDTSSGWNRVMTFLNTSAANLQSAAHDVNTQDKIAGLLVWDATNNRPLWASGSGATAPWIDGAGTTIYTPS